MKFLLSLSIIVLTTGCATTAKYNEAINSWIGSNEIDLVKSWSPPEETYETQGSKFLIYSWSQYFDGMTFYCKTIFEVRQGFITSAKATGNSCKER